MGVTADSLMVVGRRGRPARAGVRATRRIEFLVTEAERQELEQVAADMGHRVVARVIRDAIDEFVSDYRERRLFGQKPD